MTGPLDFEECSIARYPFPFVDKRETATLIRTLLPAHQAPLEVLYMDTIPRNCFNGLPPLKDETCRQWIRTMTTQAFNLVALSFEHGIVGHTCLFVNGEGTGEILVAVSPQFRERGIGTQLTRCIIQVAFEAGLDALWLSVEAANHVARHIYNKCGFSYLTMSQIDEVEMKLDLSLYRHRAQVQVGTLMNREVVTIAADRTCREAIDTMIRRRVSTLPVVDVDGRLRGVISEIDLIMEVNLGQSVSTIMTREVVRLHEHATVAQAIRIFQSKKLRMLPVTDRRNHLIGIVGRKDILTYYYRTM